VGTPTKAEYNGLKMNLYVSWSFAYLSIVHIMTLRNVILLFLASMIFTACFDKTRHKKYSITESFISYDSSDNSKGEEGRKFKYAYEEYNADSNLIYQEIYTNTDLYGDMWGKLKRKSNFFYNGKLKTKETIEVKIDYISRADMGSKGSYTYTYEYKGNSLSKILYDNVPVEEYQYDSNGNQIERKIINKSNIPEYYRYTYRNSLIIKSQCLVADTIIGSDTLIYDKNNKHIETISRYGNGELPDIRGRGSDTVIKRNNEEQIIEKKWKEYFLSYPDGPFYDVNKYFYDSSGRLLKIEYFFDNKLTTVYDFEYD
jgi:hypothetical protein